MDRNSASRKIDRTPEDKARLKALREKFQAERPSLEALVASGEYQPPIAQGEVLNMMVLASSLKSLRTAKQLSLADVSSRTGIDKAQLSRIENGLNSNPTLSTLETIVRALGAKLHFVIEDSAIAR